MSERLHDGAVLSLGCLIYRTFPRFLKPPDLSMHHAAERHESIQREWFSSQAFTQSTHSLIHSTHDSLFFGASRSLCLLQTASLFWHLFRSWLWFCVQGPSGGNSHNTTYRAGALTSQDAGCKQPEQQFKVFTLSLLLYPDLVFSFSSCRKSPSMLEHHRIVTKYPHLPCQTSLPHLHASTRDGS